MDENEIPRLSRLLGILILLQSNGYSTSKFISNKFSISVRTVYRDLKALEKAGVPILNEPGKGYYIMDGYKVPAITFSEAEANALISSEKLVLANSDLSFSNDFYDAIFKIKSVLRNNLKNKTEFLSTRITYRQNVEIRSKYMSNVLLAITNFSLIRLKYSTIEANQLSERDVEPFALYNTQGKWIMIAWCRLRGEFRSFRLDRILDVQILTENFEAHQITLSEYFEVCKNKYFVH